MGNIAQQVPGPKHFHNMQGIEGAGLLLLCGALVKVVDKAFQRADPTDPTELAPAHVPLARLQSKVV